MGVSRPNHSALSALRRRRRPGEALIQGFLFFCGAVSILTTLGIVYVLGKEALRFFASPEVQLSEFLTGTVWQPAINRFGILPLVSATLLTTTIAMAVALPLGLAAAIYLSEYARPRGWYTESCVKSGSLVSLVGHHNQPGGNHDFQGP